ncbi:hypothetical protein CBR_g38626 [Chara braunii]|uniref:Uncharacterized protein n=1 Tax=Chara braunii TaxID=69332 RepID=A0A388K0I4_CHABU|nr:hypothetical protein CBR_g38626 [Chara braunii]|eukprot:GBG63559.1 hypothetical protein CBR_g38626 [Chara braunii]
MPRILFGPSGNKVKLYVPIVDARIPENKLAELESLGLSLTPLAVFVEARKPDLSRLMISPLMVPADAISELKIRLPKEKKLDSNFVRLTLTQRNKIGQWEDCRVGTMVGRPAVVGGSKRNKEKRRCQRRVQEAEDRMKNHPISELTWGKERVPRLMEWELVEDDQAAFVKGRSIYENIVTAIEVLEVVNQEELEVAVLPLDMEKVYDRVNWSAWVEHGVVRLRDMWNEVTGRWKTSEEMEKKLKPCKYMRQRRDQILDATPEDWLNILSPAKPDPPGTWSFQALANTIQLFEIAADMKVNWGTKTEVVIFCSSVCVRGTYMKRNEMKGPKVVCDPRHGPGPNGDDDGRRQSTVPIATEGLPSVALPVLSGEEVINEIRRRGRHSNWSKFRAMYSSVIGGVTTDPSAMLISLDDHMVHRGHAVFDTAMVVGGYAHGLEAHLDRLFRSMAMARLSPPFPREILRDVILKTAGISQCRDGQIRYWVSAGPGGFGLLPSECPRSAFYVVVFDQPLFSVDVSGGSGGRMSAAAGKQQQLIARRAKAITTSVPIKPPPFCLMKTNNYIQNVMAGMEAAAQGADVAVWTDQEGYLAEGPTVSILIVSADGYLTSPTSDTALRGCTAERVMELTRHRLVMQGHVASSASSVIGGHVAAAAAAAGGADRLALLSNPLPLKGVRVQRIPVEEARRAKEMFIVGSTSLVLPIVEWDGQPVGDGRPGPVAAALYEMLEDDMRHGETNGKRTRVAIPYPPPSTATCPTREGSTSTTSRL